MCGEMKLQAISGLRKGCEPLAYVTVPKDLTKIKSKMLFGLTKRQLVCFGSAALIGVPLFFLSKGSMGTTPAALCMILVMLPFFLFALYEKNGQTPEALLGNLIQCKFTRPKKRVYQTNNAYSALEKQAELERTVGRIASGAGKRGKGRRRLTRQERKQIEAVIRQAKGDGKNHTVQASLPFRNMHPDGLCRLDDRHFSKTIAYADVSYRLAGPDDQRDIFERLCDFYNGYDPSIGVQMTLSSSHKAGGGDLFRMAAQGDELDGIRAEASGILQTQYERGSNGYVKSKYVTLTIEAESIQAARARFSRIEADTLNRFKVMGAAAKVLDGKERLALLHGLLHPRGEPFAFEWDWLAPSGLSVKDFIAPSSFEFGETRRFRMGEMYGAVSFLQILAPEIQDRILTDFMDVEGNLLVTMHVRGINQNEAIKMVKRKITDLDAMKIQEQKKAARSGYDLDILPSDLSTYGGAAKNLLQDLQSRNERMFNMTFLMLHLAPTKQKLEIAVSQSASVAQTHNCILTRLDFQQEDGLMSSLPLGLNRIQIERSLTTSALAVFIPFVTQELFMGGDAMYYGLNALSGNMILLDRKQSRCPNGLVFGTPGSGKSMSCKRCRVLSTSLRHIRATAAATANKTCNGFYKVTCMSTLFHCRICRSYHQADFSIISGCQNNNTFSEFFFELISKITKPVHIDSIHLCCKKFHTFDLLYLIHDISHGILCQFALQAFHFTVQRLVFCCQMRNLLSQIIWCRFQYFCSFIQFLFQIVIVTDQSLGCQCLD